MNNFDSNILNDITNFFLVILGIAMTLFTVIYSFIFNKKEELIKLNEDIVLGKSSPHLEQKKHFNLVYIKIFIKWNYQLISIGILSLILFLICFFTNRIITCITLKYYLFNFLLYTFYATVIYFLLILIVMLRNFVKKSKL